MAGSESSRPVRRPHGPRGGAPLRRRPPPRRAPPAPESSRWVAARIVADWLDHRLFPDRELERVTADRPFVTELALGVVRRYGTLAWVLERMVPRPPRGPLAAVIFVGFYQVLYMDRTAVHAAVNETVETAHRVAGPRDAALVNALLRRLAREREDWLRGIERAPDSVRFSHPPELLHRWNRHLGRRATRLLCAWNNRPPELVIRPRAGLDAAACAAELHAAGIDVQPHPFAPDRYLVCPRGVPFERIPGFAEGRFYAQDPSTDIAVELLDVQPGERVLDACAAPGGKTVLLAEAMRGQGGLLALDRHADRLARLRDNLRRMGHAGAVRVEMADATQLRPRDVARVLGGDGRFDAVLLDVPCSNTGVIRRRPDARWNLDQRKLDRLTATQSALLEAGWSLLAPGGRLVYSTCSLEPEEDEDLLGAWARRHPEARLVRARKLLPHLTATDGAYAALLRAAEA